MREVIIDMTSSLSTVYNDTIIRQGENNATELKIKLSEDYIGYTYALLFQLNEGTPVLSEVLVAEDDTLTYIISNAITSSAGKLKMELQASDTSGALVKSAVWHLKIDASLDGTNPTIMPEAYVPWYTQIMEVRDEYISDEIARKESEDVRISNETVRVLNETQRVLSEDARLLLENDRVDSEATRIENEDSRVASESTRVNNEADRVTNEGVRTTNETTRVTAESGRVTAEAGRVAAENARAATLAAKADKLMATNLVTNGNFSNGLTGWHLTGASYGATATSSDGGYKITVGVDATAFLSQVPTLIAGRIYHVSGKVKSDGVTKPAIRIYTAGTGEVLTDTNVTNTAWTRVSAQNTLTTIGAGPRLYLYSDWASKAGSAWFKELIVIDLTATFGAGNEPTKEHMDRLLAEFPNSWFDGTQEILPIKRMLELLDEKANKAQEAWITPTLLNGWTGTVRFFKNDQGFVVLEVQVVAGTTSYLTDICDIPIGYFSGTVGALFRDNSLGTFSVQLGVMTGKLKIFAGGATGRTIAGKMMYYVG